MLELILLSGKRPSKLEYMKVGSIAGDSLEPSAVYNSVICADRLGSHLLL